MRFLNTKILGFLFFYGKKASRRVKCEKLNFGKILGNLFDELRKLKMKETVI